MSIGSTSNQSFLQQNTQLHYLRSSLHLKQLTEQVEQGSTSKSSAQEGIAAVKTYAPHLMPPGKSENPTTVAANNILSFISARLSQDFIEGATEEELQSRLEAGLEGFLKGYGEAHKQLAALGQLIPEVKSAVENTYTAVLNGIDKLAEEYGLQSPVTNEHREPYNQDSANSESEVDWAKSYVRQVSAYTDYNANVETYESRSFDFSLKTQDGDTINISAQRSQASGMNFSEMGAYSGQNMLLAQNLESRFLESGSFFISVDGELDKDELEAIGDLLNQINNLAEDFYAGDVEQAFREAVELGFDSDEIMRFSLNLRMEQSVKVQESYSAFNENPIENVDPQQNKMIMVARFVQILETARVQAKEHNIDDISHLPEIASMHEDDEKKNDFVNFMKDMLGRLESFSSNENTRSA